jgi:N-acetylglucosamine kinase-like BadF-type ATPase
MPYFLAIDAGGTKTDYLLADDIRDLARVRSGSIKRMRVDAPTAAANLDAALAELTRLTGIPMHSIARTCIGTAGNTVPLVTDWLREALAARVSGTLTLLGDVEIALDAAFHGGPGILVLAGTGSNVAGRDIHGNLTTAGGWGPTLADQGSGHRIGLQALRATFLAIDESKPTQLLPAILAHWNLPSIEALVDFANRTPTPDVSTLTELVLRCANAEDPIARSVLHQEGEDLAHLVLLVIRRLQAADPTGPLPSIAFAGSIMENVLPVHYALVAALRRNVPAIQTLDGGIDPVQGALWRARHAS